MKSILLLALFTLTFCGSAFSESASVFDKTVANKNTSAALEEFFAETKARLDLTDEQAEKIKPILQYNFESRRAILQKYGFDPESRKPPTKKLAFSKARTMVNALEKVGAFTEGALKGILSKEQMREYKAMQKEQKNIMRAKLNTSDALGDFFAETQDRLDLTDEQTEQIMPILQYNFESRRTVLLKYGIDIENRKPPAQKLGLHKARSLKRELDKVSSKTEKALKGILSKEQMREYKAMQNEQKNKMREKLGARRR